MNEFAMYLGWFVCGCGGLALSALAVAYTMDFVWTVMKRMYGLALLIKAIQDNKIAEKMK